LVRSNTTGCDGGDAWSATASRTHPPTGGARAAAAAAGTGGCGTGDGVSGGTRGGVSSPSLMLPSKLQSEHTVLTQSILEQSGVHGQLLIKLVHKVR
jgi:hypothetical protein